MRIVNTPVKSDFFDNLQNWSSQEKSCSIVYRQNDGSSVKVNSVIVDLFSWQGNNYILMEKGQLIRLDRLVSVEDVTTIS
ncbi:hypothetical protein [Cesiribacter sp. SM1]|uniref:hypothetical protein n=1 Tax=Cesiribacter sp. SM1 TaxID=2861196 RepID=UPI001CD565AD|nr:hypothetical protein [Cesiribacter sp. SM1]